MRPDSTDQFVFLINGVQFRLYQPVKKRSQKLVSEPGDHPEVLGTQTVGHFSLLAPCS